MKNIQTIKDVDNTPGVKADYQISLARYPDGTEAYMPIKVANGMKEGPTLLITALIHGIEIGGYDTIIRLFEELNTTKLSGRIIAIPIVNPFSLNVSNRFTPQDSADLNRIFPGEAEGTISQRIAHILCKDIAEHADYVIDYHSCNPPSEFFTIVSEAGEKEVIEQSWQMAKAFGAFSVAPTIETPGTFSYYLGTMGKPSITPELVFSRRFDESSEVALMGTLNVMKYLKMIDGEIEKLKNTRPYTDRDNCYAVCSAHIGGFVYFKKSIGEQIEEDEILAEIKDPWGNIVSVIKSPVTGIIIAYPIAGNQAVTTGDKIAYIAYERQEGTGDE